MAIKLYRVKKGDTIKSIAEELGVSPWTLRSGNAAAVGDGLSEGEFLMIFDGDKGGVFAPVGGNGEQLSSIEAMVKTKLPKAETITAKTTSEEKETEPERIDSDELEALARQLTATDAKEIRAADKLKNTQETLALKRRAIELDRAQKEADTRSKDAKDDESFLQKAIKQGIARSSIVESIRRERENQLKNELEEQYRDADYRLAGVELSKKEAEEEYRRQAEDNLEAKKDELKQQYEVRDPQKVRESVEMTDMLLSNSGRERASGYLERNKAELEKLWGRDEYEKLKKRYSR